MGKLEGFNKLKWAPSPLVRNSYNQNEHQGKWVINARRFKDPNMGKVAQKLGAFRGSVSRCTGRISNVAT